MKQTPRLERRLRPARASAHFAGEVRRACQAEFQEQIIIIRERKKEREEELHGAWYTEERMKKELGYSPFLGKTLG